MSSLPKEDKAPEAQKRDKILTVPAEKTTEEYKCNERVHVDCKKQLEKARIYEACHFK